MTRLFIIALMGLVSLSASAEWYNEITFVVGDGVCGPITVRYGGTGYTVSSSTTIKTTGSTYTPTAVDCRGNSLKYELKSKTHQRGSNTYHYYTYVFKANTSYSSRHSSGRSSGDDRSQGTQTWGSDPRWGEFGRQLSGAAGDHARDVCGNAYPGLHLYAGISKAYGEYARLRATFGAFNCYAGIGKDWLFDGINKDQILWHAGVGGLYHFGGNDPWGDIAGMVTVAQTAAWKKSP